MHPDVYFKNIIFSLIYKDGSNKTDTYTKVTSYSPGIYMNELNELNNYHEIFML